MQGDCLLERRHLGPTHVPALLEYPPDGKRRPLVILIPGGGNEPIDNCKELLRETLPLRDEPYFKAYVDLPLHGERADPNLGKRFWTDMIGRFLHPIVVGMARDIVHLMDALSQRPEVNPDRIGVCGWSLGGQATLLATAVDKRIQAAIALCTPCTADLGPQTPYPETLGNLVLKTELDAMALAAHIHPTPVLLVHGTRDAWVPVRSSRLMHRALQAHYQSCPELVRYVEYPNMAHTISQADGAACSKEQGELKEEVAGWLRRFLHERTKDED